MAKGTHQPRQRIVLPNGMWVLLYENGSIKLGGYDRKLHVTEVLNRDGIAHIFANVTPDNDSPRTIAARADDLVTVERSVMTALRGIGEK
jgi:hypothetical protein